MCQLQFRCNLPSLVIENRTEKKSTISICDSLFIVNNVCLYVCFLSIACFN